MGKSPYKTKWPQTESQEDKSGFRLHPSLRPSPGQPLTISSQFFLGPSRYLLSFLEQKKSNSPWLFSPSYFWREKTNWWLPPSLPFTPLITNWNPLFFSLNAHLPAISSLPILSLVASSFFSRDPPHWSQPLPLLHLATYSRNLGIVSCWLLTEMTWATKLN